MFTNQSSVEILDHMGSDLTVVNTARVSFAKQSALVPKLVNRGHLEDEYDDVLADKDEKLIGYLAKHGHWSPFAHCFAQFRISAPIFVARQLVKHQVGLSWNEVSRRYVDDLPTFYIPAMRARAANIKQGSSDKLVDEGAEAVLLLEQQCESALKAYTNLLNLGVAPELARSVLPLCTMTEWIWSGSLMAFARMCKQRLDAHAQAETREVAELIDGHLKTLFPVAWKELLQQ